MYNVTISGTSQHITTNNATHDFVKLSDAVNYFNEKAYELGIPEDDIVFESEDSAYTRMIGHDYSMSLSKSK